MPYRRHPLYEELPSYTVVLRVCAEILLRTFYNIKVFFDFSLTVQAARHECVIRTGQP